MCVENTISPNFSAIVITFSKQILVSRTHAMDYSVLLKYTCFKLTKINYKLNNRNKSRSILTCVYKIKL